MSVASSKYQTAGAAVGRKLWIGPTGDGLWVVRDAEGVCGAVFIGREDALRFAKSECEAALPAASEWRFVPALDLTSLFAQPQERH
jgi:hypothetical protein